MGGAALMEPQIIADSARPHIRCHERAYRSLIPGLQGLAAEHIPCFRNCPCQNILDSLASACLSAWHIDSAYAAPVKVGYLSEKKLLWKWEMAPRILFTGTGLASEHLTTCVLYLHIPHTRLAPRQYGPSSRLGCISVVSDQQRTWAISDTEEKLADFSVQVVNISHGRVIRCARAKILKLATQ